MAISKRLQGESLSDWSQRIIDEKDPQQRDVHFRHERMQTLLADQTLKKRPNETDEAWLARYQASRLPHEDDRDFKTRYDRAIAQNSINIDRNGQILHENWNKLNRRRQNTTLRESSERIEKNGRHFIQNVVTDANGRRAITGTTLDSTQTNPTGETTQHTGTYYHGAENYPNTSLFNEAKRTGYRANLPRTPRKITINKPLATRKHMPSWMVPKFQRPFANQGQPGTQTVDRVASMTLAQSAVKGQSRIISQQIMQALDQQTEVAARAGNHAEIIAIEARRAAVQGALRETFRTGSVNDRITVTIASHIRAGAESSKLPALIQSEVQKHLEVTMTQYDARRAGKVRHSSSSPMGTQFDLKTHNDHIQEITNLRDGFQRAADGHSPIRGGDVSPEDRAIYAEIVKDLNKQLADIRNNGINALQGKPGGLIDKTKREALWSLDARKINDGTTIWQQAMISNDVNVRNAAAKIGLTSATTQEERIAASRRAQAIGQHLLRQTLGNSQNKTAFARASYNDKRSSNTDGRKAIVDKFLNTDPQGKIILDMLGSREESHTVVEQLMSYVAEMEPVYRGSPARDIKGQGGVPVGLDANSSTGPASSLTFTSARSGRVHTWGYDQAERVVTALNRITGGNAAAINLPLVRAFSTVSGHWDPELRMDTGQKAELGMHDPDNMDEGYDSDMSQLTNARYKGVSGMFADDSSNSQQRWGENQLDHRWKGIIQPRVSKAHNIQALQTAYLHLKNAPVGSTAARRAIQIRQQMDEMLRSVVNPAILGNVTLSPSGPRVIRRVDANGNLIVGPSGAGRLDDFIGSGLGFLAAPGQRSDESYMFTNSPSRVNNSIKQLSQEIISNQREYAAAWNTDPANLEPSNDLSAEWAIRQMKYRTPDGIATFHHSGVIGAGTSLQKEAASGTGYVSTHPQGGGSLFPLIRGDQGYTARDLFNDFRRSGMSALGSDHPDEVPYGRGIVDNVGRIIGYTAFNPLFSYLQDSLDETFGPGLGGQIAGSSGFSNMVRAFGDAGMGGSTFMKGAGSMPRMDTSDIMGIIKGRLQISPDDVFQSVHSTEKNWITQSGYTFSTDGQHIGNDDLEHLITASFGKEIDDIVEQTKADPKVIMRSLMGSPDITQFFTPDRLVNFAPVGYQSMNPLFQGESGDSEFFPTNNILKAMGPMIGDLFAKGDAGNTLPRSWRDKPYGKIVDDIRGKFGFMTQEHIGIHNMDTIDGFPAKDVKTRQRGEQERYGRIGRTMAGVQNWFMDVTQSSFRTSEPSLGLLDTNSLPDGVSKWEFLAANREHQKSNGEFKSLAEVAPVLHAYLSGMTSQTADGSKVARGPPAGKRAMEFGILLNSMFDAIASQKDFQQGSSNFRIPQSGNDWSMDDLRKNIASGMTSPHVTQAMVLGEESFKARNAAGARRGVGLYGIETVEDAVRLESILKRALSEQKSDKRQRSGVGFSTALLSDFADLFGLDYTKEIYDPGNGGMQPFTPGVMQGKDRLDIQDKIVSGQNKHILRNYSVLKAFGDDGGLSKVYGQKWQGERVRPYSGEELDTMYSHFFDLNSDKSMLGALMSGTGGFDEDGQFHVGQGGYNPADAQHRGGGHIAAFGRAISQKTPALTGLKAKLAARKRAQAGQIHPLLGVGLGALAVGAGALLGIDPFGLGDLFHSARDSMNQIQAVLGMGMMTGMVGGRWGFRGKGGRLIPHIEGYAQGIDPEWFASKTPTGRSRKPGDEAQTKEEFLAGLNARFSHLNGDTPTPNDIFHHPEGDPNQWTRDILNSYPTSRHWEEGVVDSSVPLQAEEIVRMFRGANAPGQADERDADLKAQYTGSHGLFQPRYRKNGYLAPAWDMVDQRVKNIHAQGGSTRGRWFADTDKYAQNYYEEAAKQTDGRMDYRKARFYTLDLPKSLAEQYQVSGGIDESGTYIVDPNVLKYRTQVNHREYLEMTGKISEVQGMLDKYAEGTGRTWQVGIGRAMRSEGGPISYGKMNPDWKPQGLADTAFIDPAVDITGHRLLAKIQRLSALGDLTEDGIRLRDEHVQKLKNDLAKHLTSSSSPSSGGTVSGSGAGTPPPPPTSPNNQHLSVIPEETHDPFFKAIQGLQRQTYGDPVLQPYTSNSGRSKGIATDFADTQWTQGHLEFLNRVAEIGNPAQVLMGGPGSGKTTVESARVASEIASGIAPKKASGIVSFANAPVNRSKVTTKRIFRQAGLDDKLYAEYEASAGALQTIHKLAYQVTRALGFGEVFGNASEIQTASGTQQSRGSRDIYFKDHTGTLLDMESISQHPRYKHMTEMGADGTIQFKSGVPFDDYQEASYSHRFEMMNNALHELHGDMTANGEAFEDTDLYRFAPGFLQPQHMPDGSRGFVPGYEWLVGKDGQKVLQADRERSISSIKNELDHDKSKGELFDLLERMQQSGVPWDIAAAYFNPDLNPSVLGDDTGAQNFQGKLALVAKLGQKMDEINQRGSFGSYVDENGNPQAGLIRYYHSNEPIVRSTYYLDRMTGSDGHLPANIKNRLEPFRRPYIITEAQDTNPASSRLLQHLGAGGGDRSHLTYSGDNFQGIMGFQGGESGILENLAQIAKSHNNYTYLHESSRLPQDLNDQMAEAAHAIQLITEGGTVPFAPLPPVTTNPNSKAASISGGILPMRTPNTYKTSESIQRQWMARDAAFLTGGATSGHMKGVMNDPAYVTHLKASGLMNEHGQTTFDPYHPSQIMVIQPDNDKIVQTALEYQRIGVPAVAEFSRSALEQWQDLTARAEAAGIDHDRIVGELLPMRQHKELELLAQDKDIWNWYQKETGYGKSVGDFALGQSNTGFINFMNEVIDANTALSVPHRDQHGQLQNYEGQEGTFARIGTIHSMKGNEADLTQVGAVEQYRFQVGDGADPVKSMNNFKNWHVASSRSPMTLGYAREDTPNKKWGAYGIASAEKQFVGEEIQPWVLNGREIEEERQEQARRLTINRDAAASRRIASVTGQGSVSQAQVNMFHGNTSQANATFGGGLHRTREDLAQSFAMSNRDSQLTGYINPVTGNSESAAPEEFFAFFKGGFPKDEKFVVGEMGPEIVVGKDGKAKKFSDPAVIDPKDMGGILRVLNAEETRRAELEGRKSADMLSAAGGFLRRGLDRAAKSYYGPNRPEDYMSGVGFNQDEHIIQQEDRGYALGFKSEAAAYVAANAAQSIAGVRSKVGSHVDDQGNTVYSAQLFPVNTNARVNTQAFIGNVSKGFEATNDQIRDAFHTNQATMDKNMLDMFGMQPDASSRTGYSQMASLRNDMTALPQNAFDHQSKMRMGGQSSDNIQAFGESDMIAKELALPVKGLVKHIETMGQAFVGVTKTLQEFGKNKGIDPTKGMLDNGPRYAQHVTGEINGVAMTHEDLNQSLTGTPDQLGKSLDAFGQERRLNADLNTLRRPDGSSGHPSIAPKDRIDDAIRRSWQYERMLQIPQRGLQAYNTVIQARGAQNRATNDAALMMGGSIDGQFRHDLGAAYGDNMDSSWVDRGITREDYAKNLGALASTIDEKGQKVQVTNFTDLAKILPGGQSQQAQIKEMGDAANSVAFLAGRQGIDAGIAFRGNTGMMNATGYQMTGANVTKAYSIASDVAANSTMSVQEVMAATQSIGNMGQRGFAGTGEQQQRAVSGYLMGMDKRGFDSGTSSQLLNRAVSIGYAPDAGQAMMIGRGLGSVDANGRYTGQYTANPAMFQEMQRRAGVANQIAQMPIQVAQAQNQSGQMRLETKQLSVQAQSVAIETAKMQEMAPVEKQQMQASNAVMNLQYGASLRQAQFAVSMQPQESRVFYMQQQNARNELRRDETSMQTRREYEDLISGAPGTNRSYQAYFSAQANQMAQGSSAANAGSNIRTAVNAVGLEAARTYRGLDQQATMLTLGQSSLNAGASYAAQMQYIQDQKEMTEIGYEGESKKRKSDREIEDEAMAERKATLKEVQSLEAANFEESQRQAQETLAATIAQGGVIDANNKAFEINMKYYDQETSLKIENNKLQQDSIALQQEANRLNIEANDLQIKYLKELQPLLSAGERATQDEQTGHGVAFGTYSGDELGNMNATQLMGVLTNSGMTEDQIANVLGGADATSREGMKSMRDVIASGEYEETGGLLDNNLVGKAIQGQDSDKNAQWDIGDLAAQINTLADSADLTTESMKELNREMIGVSSTAKGLEGNTAPLGTLTESLDPTLMGLFGGMMSGQLGKLFAGGGAGGGKGGFGGMLKSFWNSSSRGGSPEGGMFPGMSGGGFMSSGWGTGGFGARLGRGMGGMMIGGGIGMGGDYLAGKMGINTNGALGTIGTFTGMGAAFGPYGMAAGALVGGGIVAWQHRKEIMKWAKELGDSIVGGLSDAKHWVSNKFGDVKDSIGDFFEGIISPFKSDEIKKIAKFAFDYLLGPISAIHQIWEHKDDIIAGAQSAWDFIKGLFDGVVDFFADKKDLAMDAVTTLFDIYMLPFNTVKDFFTEHQEDLIGVATSMWDGLTDIFNTLKDLGSNALDGIGDMADLGKTVINSIIIAPLNSLIKAISGLKINGPAGLDINMPDLPEIPEFASGGFAPGGAALVGENGPELVRLSKGSEVMPASRTMQMMRDYAIGADIRTGANRSLNSLLESRGGSFSLDPITARNMVGGGSKNVEIKINIEGGANVDDNMIQKLKAETLAAVRQAMEES